MFLMISPCSALTNASFAAPEASSQSHPPSLIVGPMNASATDSQSSDPRGWLPKNTLALSRRDFLITATESSPEAREKTERQIIRVETERSKRYFLSISRIWVCDTRGLLTPRLREIRSQFLGKHASASYLPPSLPRFEQHGYISELHWECSRNLSIVKLLNLENKAKKFIHDFFLASFVLWDGTLLIILLDLLCFRASNTCKIFLTDCAFLISSCHN